MKIRGSRRLIKQLGLALAIAAFAAPSAQAVVVADESGAPNAVQPTFLPDDLHSSLPGSPVVESRGYAPINTRVQLDEPRGYAPVNTLVRRDTPPVSSALASESSSFDWADAGIGAGIMFALLGFGAAIVAARQTRRSRLSAV